MLDTQTGIAGTAWMKQDMEVIHYIFVFIDINQWCLWNLLILNVQSAGVASVMDKK